ncbi:MAG TPA: hypothetical protein VGH13_09840 [Xanthobacteraceae bacterium]
MRKTIISFSAVAFVMALGAAPVFAQNMQGPGAENYNAGSGPQTGGKLTTEPATPQGQQGRTTQGRGLYNSAGQPNNPAGVAPRGNKNGAARNNSMSR